MTFKNLDEALEWLDKHDPPDESEIDCTTKHKILYIDSSNPSWFEFQSDESLIEWIEEQRSKIEENIL